MIQALKKHFLPNKYGWWFVQTNICKRNIFFNFKKLEIKRHNSIMQHTKRILKLVVCLASTLLITSSAINQEVPHQIKWFAEVHADSSNASFPAPELSVEYDSDNIIIKSNGIPTFEFIEKTPNALQVQSHNWFIRRNPVPADTFTQIPLLGTVAFTTTGLPIYGPNEAERPDPYGDPYVNQILDFCHGHTGGQGDYHFHAAPECLIQHPDGSEEHYNIVGFALDGYPLVAHYKSVLDASGNPILDANGKTQFDWLETSGYEPTPDYKRQVIENGGISTYAWDNYNYDINRANRTLDEGNGRLLSDKIIVGGLSEKEFFNFDYAYFVAGEFPYFIAKYRGQTNIRGVSDAGPSRPDGTKPPADKEDGTKPPKDGDTKPPADKEDAAKPPKDGDTKPPADKENGTKPPKDEESSSQIIFSNTEAVNLNSSFDLHLSLSGDFRIAGWQTDITYNPEVLRLLSVTGGKILADAFFQEGTIDNEAGRLEGLSSALLGQGTISTPGVLLSLTFESLKEGESVIRLENTIFSDDMSEEQKISLPDKLIRVVSSIPCDVNADGITNIFDLILVAQKFGQKNVSDRADTNNDGEINIFDLIIVAQCFGQSAAPTTLKEPISMFSMVNNWVQLAEQESDGSAEFKKGTTVLRGILESLKPKKTALMANYPNPFNPETWIPYHLSQDSEVIINIYDTTGKIIRSLDMGFQSFGYYASRDNSAYWDGRTENGEQVSSGTYFYQINAGGYTETRKMVILK